MGRKAHHCSRVLMTTDSGTAVTGVSRESESRHHWPTMVSQSLPKKQR